MKTIARRTSSLLTPYLTIVFSVACALPLCAEQAASQASLDDLKAPPSPAFVLLDVAPSKVDRPQAVRPLVMSALSAVSTEGFPHNYAVEFAPYWLGTPRLSFDDYYKSTLKSIPRHLSISVATTPLSKTTDSGTALGVGVRTLPLPGRAHPRLITLRAKLHDLQRKTIDEEGFFSRRLRLISLLQEGQAAAAKATATALSTEPFEDLIGRMIDVEFEIERQLTLLSALAEDLGELKMLPDTAERRQHQATIEKEQKEAQALLDKRNVERKTLGSEMLKEVQKSDVATSLATEKTFETLVARYEQAQKARAAKNDKDLRDTALAIQALDTQRVGLLLAVAGAATWDIPEDQTSRATIAKVGVWVTPGYRFVRCTGQEEKQTCSTSLDVLAVARYLDNKRSAVDSGSFEGGLRVIWQARTKLALSAEWLGRSGDDSSPSRVVGVAEYEISDAAFLYASFGRDFEEADVRQNLVSTIGLTFGLGKKPIITDK